MSTQKSAADEYWDNSQKPWPTLLFLLPLLVAYEFGILFAQEPDPESLRNGADAWLRTLMTYCHLEDVWLLPMFIVFGLLGWHLSNNDSWKISPGTLGGMLAESLLFAFILIFVGQLLVLGFRQISGSDPVLTSMPTASLPALAMTSSQWSRIISYLGAGIYEETLFRLCLIPFCYGLLNSLFRSHRLALVGAVVISSLLFSGAHYLTGHEQLTGFNATFRLLAGIYFSGLFLYRGFGITVGCHAVYDVIVGVLWWS
ncbi:MAG: CPBP family intramembrane glutamic endopeptidase [Planctomycetaceae bacterium]